MYGLSLVTPAATEPVTLDEVRRQLALGDNTTHDAMLLTYIAAARDYVERYTNRQLVTATWDLQIDWFPLGLEPIYLPRGPLQSVTSITYLAAADGASTTWSSANYRVLTSTDPGKIVPAFSVAYPASRWIAGAVTIRFVAGYGAASAVPAQLKQAILLLVTNLFESRGGEMFDSDAVKFLLESYRMPDDFLKYERDPTPGYSQYYQSVYE